MGTFVHRALWLGAVAALALAGPATGADTSRQCMKAQRKVAKEESWTVRGEASIERDRKARAACTAKSACARYDARLQEMDKRKLRHDARLARFKADAAKACTTG
jgi:hypothetical protein